jgi:outer membrane protein assembly factor BamA
VRRDRPDRPGDPHHGTDFYARYAGFHDIGTKNYGFSRLEVGVTQYVPLANAKRVVALHAETDLTYTTGDNRVPFYMQPTLGGPHKLRGFSQYRFTDNNSLLVSGEYPWEIFPGLDMAMFADAGNVFSKRGDFGFKHVEVSGGLGFRMKSRDAVAIRLDAGVSREGVAIWFTTSNIFSR